MLIVSWNVNSINARLEDVNHLLDKYDPDILLLQEIKCEEHKFPKFEKYFVYINGQKAYNGVAILSKYELRDIRHNFHIDNSFKITDNTENLSSIHDNLFKITNSTENLSSIHDDQSNEDEAFLRDETLIMDEAPLRDEARYIEAKLILPSGQEYYFASVYVPNGKSVGSSSYVYKINFLNKLYVHLKNLETKNFILGGDFNVAPFDLDVFSSEAMQGGLSCTLKERQSFRKALNVFDDSFRVLNPLTQHFTWWDYRNGSFSKNTGLRIDFILTSTSVTNCLKFSSMYKDFRSTVRPSDHIPCAVEF